MTTKRKAGLPEPEASFHIVQSATGKFADVKGYMPLTLVLKMMELVEQSNVKRAAASERGAGNRRKKPA